MSDCTVKLTIKGVRPLLMHSAQASDPLSPMAKAMKKVSGIRKKTEADHLELAKLDWFAAFYQDAENKPIVTADMIMGSLISGAKKLKLGQQAKAGIIVVEDCLLLDHGHPAGSKATINDFWNDGSGPFIDSRGVRVQQARIQRYRPIFRTWRIEPVVELYDFDPDQLQSAAEAAGRQCGIGDFRPRFGTFSVESMEIL